MTEQFRAQGVANPHDDVVAEFRTNRYDADTKTLVFTDKQVKAFDTIQQHYADYFGEPSTKYGLLPHLITDPGEIRDLTAFFAWTAWAAAAERPGHSYSYTNNWPAEPRVDNGPTGSVVVWSVLSLIMLLGGIGVMFTVYGRWSQNIGWHGTETTKLHFRQPGEVPLTRSQRAAIWIFAVVAVLFLAQVVLGGAVEHYRADLSEFYGIDLAKILPYNLARTWHLQLSLFWTAAAFLAAESSWCPSSPAANRASSRSWSTGCSGAGCGGVRLADLRGAVDLRCDQAGHAGIAAVGVPGPAAGVPGAADRLPVLVDRDHLARDALEAGYHLEDEPALDVLLHRPGHPDVLRGQPAGRQRGTFLGGRLLAVLDGAPVGGGLPGAVHHRDGGLHVRPARRGPRAGRVAGHLPRHHLVLGGG